jgi:hypothetical protein
MNLNERLKIITDNLDNYYSYRNIPDYANVQNFAFDIEACYLKEKNEMLTYSIALMSCDNNSDICYHYRTVDTFMKDLLSIKKKTINLFAHNALYDIKPFILWFTEQDGAKQRLDEYYEKQCYDFYNKKKEKLKFTGKNKTKLKPFEYNLIMKDGVFYKLTLQGDDVTINFYDTFKIAPYSLQKCCDDFLKLHLPKDGLDYEKERSSNDILTKEELSYIYNDVYGLSYLVKMLKINGLDIYGKHVVYTKLTNSGQSLEDYKETILEDYSLKQNMFKNQDLYDYVDNGLMRSKFFQTDKPSLKKQIIFECLFPKQSYFTDSWQRHSYYGGLSTVCFENVEKFKKYKNHNGIVLDVNSLYPYIMSDRLLPYGQANYKDLPYCKMNESYKKCFPLYIQEITIYDFEVKENKMAFLQVKDNPNFNGREILKNNIKDGEKVTLTFRLCNPLLELLFECYNVYSYELGGHMAFAGSHDLFKNYIDFWSEVKKNSTGANRAIAKLRQNGLYGKFGMSGSNEITEFENLDGVFSIKHLHDEYVSDNIYLPMATFITSYAKQYLVQAINANYERFLYCDTDSLHLYGTVEEVKGVNIGAKIYGYWDNEMCFEDFKYIGSKRYAEKDSTTHKWEIKCCGLTDSIMKQVDDIEVFDNCPHTTKEIKNMKLYTKENDVYYYYDKECTKKIVGLIKSKKSKIIKGGTLIQEQPYKISNSYYLF